MLGQWQTTVRSDLRTLHIGCHDAVGDTGPVQQSELGSAVVVGLEVALPRAGRYGHIIAALIRIHHEDIGACHARSLAQSDP